MYYLKYVQKIPVSIEDCWAFFSSPANLKIITPDHLGFKIINQDGIEKTYPGQIIVYTISPICNIPIKWVTEITHVHEPHYFIDEQRMGPYKLWHHEHRFLPIPGGVEMIDTVYYDMPFGPLGKLIHHVKVKKDLEMIFDYRRSKIKEIFGS